MGRAFKSMTLPLGSYQRVHLDTGDLGDQFTRSGGEPRVLIAHVEGQGDAPFDVARAMLILTEEAQRHLIAALQANLDDDGQRARELIAVFHSEYGRIKP